MAQPALTLEEQLDATFTQLDVAPAQRESVHNLLAVIKRKDVPTYEHSIRVALLGVRIAQYAGQDPKTLLFAGALHDIGKILIPPETLKKTEGFNEEDMTLMRGHPEYAHRILRGMHEHSAEVAVRHHRFQKNAYPAKLPETPIPFCDGRKVTLEYCARLLAIADFYDALGRPNDKHGAKRPLSPEERKAILLRENADQRYLIEKLYEARILGPSDNAA